MNIFVILFNLVMIITVCTFWFLFLLDCFSGGIIVTVTGTNLNSISTPVMAVTVAINNEVKVFHQVKIYQKKTFCNVFETPVFHRFKVHACEKKLLFYIIAFQPCKIISSEQYQCPTPDVSREANHSSPEIWCQANLKEDRSKHALVNHFSLLL